ncbi:MAG: sigma 54-interacting transcriptional regulator [Byssovorax sp.]
MHDASPRKDGPFIVFDCSGVAPSLVEDELFSVTSKAPSPGPPRPARACSSRRRAAPSSSTKSASSRSISSPSSCAPWRPGRCAASAPTGGRR